MSLSASMWTSVSGLLAHGEKMNVIGNNISNVNTVGFKSQRMDFQDYVYQGIGTANGIGQVGRGTSIGIIMNDFSQGGYEDSTNATDISINGNGFFAVKPMNNNMTYYTRAGNFRFDKEGYLVDPHGYVLQGWEIDRESQRTADRTATGIIGTGSPVDIKLDSFTCPPRATQNIIVPANLRNSKVASTDDNCSNSEDPFFSMLKTWDATQTPALGTSNYAYQSTMEVYDEAGKLHKLTIHYDRVSNGENSRIDEYTDSESYWEYIITMDPSEDVRDFSSQYTPGTNAATQPDVPERLKGLLGAGTMTFSASGQLKDMTAFVPHTDGTAGDKWWTGAAGNETVDLDKWIAAPINNDGLPVVAPNFSGTAGLSQAYQNGIWDQPNAHADGKLVAVDLGLRSKSNSWNFGADPSGKTPGTYFDTAGNQTGLVKASGITRTFDEQTKVDGKYQWTATDAMTGEIYAISSKSTTQPSGMWVAATPPSDATEYEWNLTVSGEALPIPAKSTTSTPVFTVSAAANPDTARYHAYTDSVTSLVIQTTRAGLSDPILSPSEFKNATWTETSPGSGVWETGGGIANGGATMTDASKTYTPDTIRAAVVAACNKSTWGDADPQHGTNPVTGAPDPAVEYNWVLLVDGVESDTTLSPTASALPKPTVTGQAATGNNASEFYWADQYNPNTILTSSTNTLPTVPAGASTKVMQTVHASNRYFVNGLNASADLQETATTNLGDNFYEHSGRYQDGYTYGDLRYVNVSADGVLSANYSNGVTLELYQITLHDFPSTQNLRREGGNLFSETSASGVPNSGAAGTGTFGATQGYSLEQSNVDLSREFVNMITTQRGFQANSKGITTVDTMLETVISMKR